jgi:hypothetical protein
MEPGCVTISRPVPPLQFNSKLRCAIHIVQYYRGTSSYWDREHFFPSDHYELLLVNTNVGPQRREVYQYPNFQTQGLLVENPHVHGLSKFSIQQSAFCGLHRNIPVKLPETVILTQPEPVRLLKPQSKWGKQDKKTC